MTVGSVLDGAARVLSPFLGGGHAASWIIVRCPHNPASAGQYRQRGNHHRNFVSTVPQRDGHYWVINETRWDGDEMIVDVHTIVNERRAMEPTLSHFLLLIVAGELRGVQHIPLEPGADCRAEEEV